MRSPPITSLALLVLLLSVGISSAPARAQEVVEDPRGPVQAQTEAMTTQTGPLSLSLVLLGGFKGELGLPHCRGEGSVDVRHSEYARLVTAVQSIIGRTRGPQPLVLHTGDLHFPGALSRHLVDGGDEGIDRLFEMLERIPYDGVGLGGLDLSLPSDRVAPFFARAEARGFPLLAANVTCNDDAPRPEVCSALGTSGGREPFQVVERGGARIALISVLDPSHTQEIPPEKSRGLAMGDFAGTVKPLVARIRAEDLADLVVVINHTYGRSQELSLLASLPEIDGVDLVVLKQLKDGVWGNQEATAEGRDLGWSRVPGSGTTVLTAGRGVSQAVLAELELRSGESGWTLAPRSARLLDVSTTEPDADTTSTVDELASAYCRDWGRPVEGYGRLTSPMGEDGFRRYVLDVMRDEARTELALLNVGALRNTDLLPTADPLTRADLHALLPFGGELVRARIPGEMLWFFADNALVGGMERVGSGLRVNGRPVDVTRTYTVVMNRFTADGGDGIVPPGTLKRRTALEGEDGEPLELVDLLLRSLEERRFVRRSALDPKARHVDLSKRPLFRFSGSANLSYTKVAVENPEVPGENPGDPDAPAYTKSQLSTFSSDRLSLDARLLASGDTRDHDFGGSVFLAYSFSEFAEELGGRYESGDWIRGKLNYDFAGLRSLAGGNGFVPVPFIEGQLQTEFDKPETRDWHRLELTAIAGARLRPLPAFTFMVGGNVRHEVLEPDSRVLGGIVVSYTLRRTTLARILNNPIELESETSWFYNDIGRWDIHEIQHFTRLYFQLLQKLFVTTSASVYAYRERPVGAWGAYLNVTVGLSFGSTSAVQAL